MPIAARAPKAAAMVITANPITLFDRHAWRMHRDRAARSGCVDFLHAEVAKRLIERLEDIGGRFRTALDFGAQSGTLSRALARQPEMEWVVAADPSLEFLVR